MAFAENSGCETSALFEGDGKVAVRNVENSISTNSEEVLPRKQIEDQVLRDKREHWKNSDGLLLDLRKFYAKALLWLAVLQAIFMNVLFPITGLHLKYFEMDPVTSRIFFISALTEILGVVIIVVRHLFPIETSPFETAKEFAGKTLKELVDKFPDRE